MKSIALTCIIMAVSLLAKSQAIEFYVNGSSFYSFPFENVQKIVPNAQNTGLELIETNGNQYAWLSSEIDSIELNLTPIVTNTPNSLEAATIKVFPNPSSDQLTIQYGASIQFINSLEVYTITGKRVKSWLAEELISSQNQLIWNWQDQSGNSLDNGTYIIRANSNQGALSTQVIKQ